MFKPTSPLLAFFLTTKENASQILRTHCTQNWQLKRTTQTGVESPVPHREATGKPHQIPGIWEVQQRHGHRPCCGTGATLVRLGFLIRNLSERTLPWASQLRNAVSWSTTSHPPQHQARQAWHVLLWRSVPGTCAPSAGELLHEPLRLCVPHFAVCRISLCFPVLVESTDHRGIHSQLDTPENGESIHHHFQTARIMHVCMSRTMTLVVTLTADTGCNVLHCESPPPQNPSTSTSCAVATGIEWKATPAVAPSQREGKTTKEKDSEQV